MAISQGSHLNLNRSLSMIIEPIKTDIIRTSSVPLTDVLDKYVKTVKEKDILVITSKIISLCEGRTILHSCADKQVLAQQESTYYLPPEESKYGHHFTITNNTLIPCAGIDESNGDGNLILWPKDSQKTANQVRDYLKKRFGLKYVGVVITDSTCRPLRRGTTGIALAHSGFKALHNYIGDIDLFGRPFTLSKADVSGGLAAAAVVAMGEGSERTPLALISKVPFITFQTRNPSVKELRELKILKEDDLFAPFLEKVKWLDGEGGTSNIGMGR